MNVLLLHPNSQLEVELQLNSNYYIGQVITYNNIIYEVVNISIELLRDELCVVCLLTDYVDEIHTIDPSFETIVSNLRSLKTIDYVIAILLLLLLLIS